MFYYKHHIGDFIRATSRLTDAQTMAYLRLIWRYYDKQQPLPNDFELLAFQIGGDQDTVRLILQSYFKLDDQGLWRHSRCDKEIKEYEANQEKRSRAGKASAERKKNASETSVKRKSNRRSTPVEQVSDSSSADEQLTINHKPITNNQSKKDISVVQKPEDLEDQVWEDYLQARKAPLTQTAYKLICNEASRAGISPAEAIRFSAEHGWRGFKAEWYEKANPKVKVDEFGNPSWN